MTTITFQVYETQVRRFSGELISKLVDDAKGETRAEASRALFAAKDSGKRGSVYALACRLPQRSDDWSGWDGVEESDIFMTGDEERFLFG